MVAELLGRSGQSLADLLAARRAAFPSSGEINFRVADVQAAVARIAAAYAPLALGRDTLDGLSPVSYTHLDVYKRHLFDRLKQPAIAAKAAPTRGKGAVAGQNDAVGAGHVLSLIHI